MQHQFPKSFKTELCERIRTALTLAPSLSVLILSAVYQSVMQLSGYPIDRGIPLLLGWLTVFSVLASTLLGTVLKRRLTTLFLTVLFGLCFLFSAMFYLAGTTDLLSDAFFESVMLVFTLPSYAYMSVADSLSSVPAVPSLILSGLLFVVNLGASTYLICEEKHRD